MGRPVLLRRQAEALLSRMWWYMIAVDNGNITYYGRDSKIEAKRSPHAAEVANGMLTILIDPLHEADVDLIK